MKTLFYTSIVIIGCLLMNCTSPKEKTATELLKNPQMEQDIYTAILNDNNYLSKFMEKMMANENCKSMMEKNNLILTLVCRSEKMDSMLNNDKYLKEKISNIYLNSMVADSVVCDKTCNKIIENPQLNGYFKKRIWKH